jgi:SPP1 family predicted phage head-tail adaptor
MRAGQLKHRAQIQSLVSSQDSDGHITESWVDFGSKIWINLMPLSGRELLSADAIQSKVTAKAILRFRAGVLPSMRLTYRDTLYNIEAVIPDSNSGREMLTLLLSYGTNDG